MMEEMKQSGIQWVGEVPSDWTLLKMKHFSYMKGRIGWQGLTADEFIESGPYLITGTDFENGHVCWDRCYHISEKRYDEAVHIQVHIGDLLVTKDGTIGKLAYVNELPDKASLNSHLLVVRPIGEKYINKFLYWVLYSSVFQGYYEFESYGSTMDSLSQEKIGEFSFYAPSIREQKNISEYLDSECAKLDAVISTVQQQIDILKAYKKSLITETVTKGLDKNTEMKDSGTWIGAIPVGWEMSKIKYLVDGSQTYPIGDGDHGMIKADDYLTEGIPYIRVLNLTWGKGLSMEDIVYIDEAMNSKIKNSELHPHDILIAKTGATIGKTAIVPDWMPRSNTTSHVGKITLPKTHCPEFFYHQMNSDVIQLQIADLSAMQSTRPELGIEGLKNLEVVVPPINIQKSIANYLDSRCEAIDAVTESKRAQLDVMISRKASLIYEYVTGKKRVKEVV